MELTRPRNTSCTYISALLLLIANKLTSQDRVSNTHLETDDGLIDEGLGYVDRMARSIEDERLRRLYLGCCELNARATTAFLGVGDIAHSYSPKAVSWPTLGDFYGAFAIGDIEAEDGPRRRNAKPGTWPSEVANMVELNVLG